MGFLLLFILLSWSISQVMSAARRYGITSHAGRKRSEALQYGSMYGRVFYHVKLYVYGYTNNLRGPNELWLGRVTAARHTSAEWYLFGGCNVLVVTTFRTGLLLFPLLFIVITRTWWVQQHLLWRSENYALRASERTDHTGQWTDTQDPTSSWVLETEHMKTKRMDIKEILANWLRCLDQ
jgi:hypothetical protein